MVSSMKVFKKPYFHVIYIYIYRLLNYILSKSEPCVRLWEVDKIVDRKILHYLRKKKKNISMLNRTSHCRPKSNANEESKGLMVNPYTLRMRMK